MSRYARRREPNVRRKQRIELGEINVPLRAVLLGVAILVAALAFGSAINQLLSIKTGWQEIEVASPQTVAHQSFRFSYPIGMGETSARKELRAVTAAYTEALDAAYRALAGEEFEGVGNLFALNRQPNAEVAVEPALYAALELCEAAGSRYLYLAPLMQQYTALYACSYDEEAALYDPAKNADAREFAEAAAAYAADPASVQLRLLPDCRVRLEVSQAYLDFARENEIETFVDLGILRNAFLCDAAADALAAQGFDRGAVSSLDGYTRNMGTGEFALDLLDLKDGKISLLGSATYDAPGTLAVLRAFPLSSADRLNYYVYADGTVVPPYLASDGMAHAEASFLAALSTEESAASLALRTLNAITGNDPMFPQLEELSWVSVRNGEAALHGTLLKMQP